MMLNAMLRRSFITAFQACPRLMRLVLLRAFFAIAVVAAFGVCSARGQQLEPSEIGGSPYVQRMMSLDRDADGLLSAQELPGKLRDLLKTHDTNNDERLDTAELQKIERNAMTSRDSRPRQGSGRTMGRRGGRGQGRAHAPGNSPLDKEQILRFALTFDRDRDGGLNAEELQRYAAALAVRRATVRASRQGDKDIQQPQRSANPPTPLGLSGDDAKNTDDPFGGPPK